MAVKIQDGHDNFDYEIHSFDKFKSFEFKKNA